MAGVVFAAGAGVGRRKLDFREAYRGAEEHALVGITGSNITCAVAWHLSANTGKRIYVRYLGRSPPYNHVTRI
jgi:hypothetical protein